MNPAKELSELFEIVAKEIDMSQTMIDKAIESYEAVGNFLGNNIEEHDLHIMPQGSFNLGTVIKPLTDTDEYDIDLVCLLKDGQYLTEKELKERTGEPLKRSQRYKHVEEGRRCWKIQYSDFHMDILPSVPVTEFVPPSQTDIRITHKNDDDTYSPSSSNPYQYQVWFESRMEMPLRAARVLLAEQRTIEVDEVPTYRVRTPLQKAVQLLKRHRDIMFKDSEDAPISIIITTLAAHAYTGQDNLYSALEQILNYMGNYIVYDPDLEEYIISNPTNSEENFADKWKETPQKLENFMLWMQKASEDFKSANFLNEGFESIRSKMSHMFGENIATKSVNEYGQSKEEQRKQGDLYVTTSKPTLTNPNTQKSTKIVDHTFYGK